MYMEIIKVDALISVGPLNCNEGSVRLRKGMWVQGTYRNIAIQINKHCAEGVNNKSPLLQRLIYLFGR